MTILEAWDGTPYMHGQSRCGVAVDCANFVAAVLCEWLGRQFCRVESDEINAVASAFNADNVFVPGINEVVAGDVVVIRIPRRSLLHATIVGDGDLWHATKLGGKVARVPLQSFDRHVHSIWRVTNG